jgi:hypothetical protein
MDEITDELFVRAFERGDVLPSDFDHRSHLRVAWVYLKEAASRDEAVARIRGGIQRFAAAAGKSQKYHETITVAWMILLEDVRARVPADADLADAIRAYPALADRDLPLRFYSRDRLFSDDAREGWISPDLRPLAVDTAGSPA